MDLDDVLRLPKQIQSDLSTVFQTIQDQGYTGSVTIHFRNGQPQVVEVAPPQIRLTRPRPVAVSA